MTSRKKVDRLSVLPKNAIDSILTRLPCLEVVRTSILAQCWRYQWHSLSKISVDYVDLSRNSAAAFVKIIDHILLVHRGSVDKFELCNLPSYNDIDRWILSLSRNGIKELTIKNRDHEPYDFPSSLYSCCDLTYLKLSGCILEPPAALIKAFSNLTELFLIKVVITDQGLEKLLNSCPLLSKLTLLDLDNLSDLDWPLVKINAPNLVFLHIKEGCCDSKFMYAPLLTSAYFDFNGFFQSDSIFELLGSMPILQRLELKNSALQNMHVDGVPTCLPFMCPIKYLAMDFELGELQTVFCIIRSSPFMENLVLTPFSQEYILSDGFWEEEPDLSFKLDHLQKAVVTRFCGTEDELKLIKFLLGNAPALVTMEIQLNEEYMEDSLTVVIKLTRFPRISPRAELIIQEEVSD